MSKEIRYMQGPDHVWLGDLSLKLGEWKPASDYEVEQALLPGRKEEFQFESRESVAGTAKLDEVAV